MSLLSCAALTLTFSLASCPPAVACARAANPSPGHALLSMPTEKPATQMPLLPRFPRIPPARSVPQSLVLEAELIRWDRMVCLGASQCRANAVSVLGDEMHTRDLHAVFSYDVRSKVLRDIGIHQERQQLMHDLPWRRA